MRVQSLQWRKIAAQIPKQKSYFMRNLLIFLLLVAIFVIGKGSCHSGFFHFGGGIKGSGPVQTQTRTVSDFHGVSLDFAGTVEVTIGSEYFVEVSAQENILPVIKTEVKNGVLHIFSEENISSHQDLKVRITAPAFDRLSVGGSGVIRVMNAIQAENMEMNVGGSGDIFCAQADFGRLETNIGGSGTVELGGKVNDMESSISGSGDVKAKSLSVNKLEVSISGSGTVTADVITSLNASISGSGDVFYSGNPNVETSVSGSGTVKKIQVQ